MKAILSVLALILFSIVGFAQDAKLQATDYVVEVTLSSESADLGDLEFRYSELVSNSENTLIVKTSKDKSSFAEKELRNKFPLAKVKLLSGEAYLNRTKVSK